MMGVKLLECSDHDEFDKFDLESDKRNEYFRGRNKQTLWSKSSYQSARTKSKNIAKMFPGPKAAAKNIVDEIVAFNKIIDTKMIDEIVRCTNLYIQYKKVTCSIQEIVTQKIHQGRKLWLY
ncbi:hypothetical protein QE152_g7692 [Popillia japonica]|uniref:Uncharacterized protein n=1 Tax=Popillia japonica TaxID=7064 RepID=A0AAW1ME62_POPJA